MPTSYVKKIAKKKKISLKKAEDRWKSAKMISKERTGEKDNWSYTMGVFKKMMKESKILRFDEFIG